MKKWQKICLIAIAVLLVWMAINTLVIKPAKNKRIVETTPAINATVASSEPRYTRGLVRIKSYDLTIKYDYKNQSRTEKLSGVEGFNPATSTITIHEDPNNNAVIVVEGEPNKQGLNDGISMLIVATFMALWAFYKEILFRFRSS